MSSFLADTECGLGLTTSVGLAVIGAGQDNCPGQRVSFTYTAEDACGRLATHTQTLTIVNDGPEFTNCPSSLIVIPSIANLPTPTEIQAAVNALQNSLIVSTSCGLGNGNITNNFGGQGIGDIITFTVFDVCGRSGQCSVVVVEGTEPIPTMSQWGLLIFGLLVLNLGVSFVRRTETIL